MKNSARMTPAVLGGFFGMALCLAVFAALAHAAPKHSPSLVAVATKFLSGQESDAVLAQIDNECGDSWCESDFNFIFDAFECDFEAARCDFTFHLYPLDRTDLI